MGGWMDVDGWMDGWTDGRTDRQTTLGVRLQKFDPVWLSHVEPSFISAPLQIISLPLCPV